MILLKMGGSVITDKSVPLLFRRDAVVALAAAVAEVARSEPVMLVHGGGSFGHHYSVMYDMHTKPAGYDLRGFAVVRNSMVHLHHLILDALVEGGVVPYSCPPSSVMLPAHALGDAHETPDRFEADRIREATLIARSGMSPVTYGDAVWCGEGTSCILSGDAIMARLAEMLDVRLAIFATDVDGLYTGMDSDRLIRRVDAELADRMADGISSTRADGGSDVTGGMARKVRAAGRMSGKGTDVLFVNGNKPRRIVDASRGVHEGTLFEAAGFREAEA